MKLHQVHICRFAGLQDVHFSFQEGFQVLYAPNESGKTTLLRFIQAVFYGLGHNKSKNPLQNRSRYQSWYDGGNCSGSVTFEHEGRIYLLSRKFGDTAAGDVLDFYDSQTGEKLPVPWGNKQEPGEYFFDLNEAAFVLSTFIQNAATDFVDVQAGAQVLGQKLQALLGELDERISYEQVDQMLEQALKKLKNRSGQENSIPFLEEEVERLEQELALLQKKNLDLDFCSKKVQDAEEKLAEAEKKAEEATDLVQKQRLLSQEAQQILQEEEQKKHLQLWQRSKQDTEEKFYQMETDPDSVRRVQEALEESLRLLAKRREDLEEGEKKIQFYREEQETLMEEQKQLGILETELEPWKQYEEKKQDYEALKKEKQIWLDLAEARDLLCTLRRQANTKREELRELAGAQQLYLEKKTLAEQEREAAKVAEVHSLRNLAEQESLYKREKEFLEKRQADRDQEFRKRQQNYFKFLNRLKWAGGTLLPIGLMLLFLSFMLKDRPWILQSLQIGGLLSLAAAGALFVRRSVFPPARPTIVRSTDAESDLAQCAQKVEELRAIYEQKKSIQEEKDQNLQDWQEKVIQLQSQEQRLQNEYKLICEEEEEQKTHVDQLEIGWEHSPSPELLEKEEQNIRKQFQDWEDWQSTFFVQHGIEREEDYPRWSAQAQIWAQKQERCKKEIHTAQEEEKALTFILQAEQKQLWEKNYRRFHLQDEGQVVEELYAKVEELHKLQQNYSEWNSKIEALLAANQKKTIHAFRMDVDQRYLNWMQGLKSLNCPCLQLQEWEQKDERIFNWQKTTEEQFQKREEQRIEALQVMAAMQKELEWKQGQITCPEQELEQLIQSRKEELQRREQYYEALQQARLWLREAQKELEQSFIPQVNEKTAFYLQRLTSGRYADARVSAGMTVRLNNGLEPKEGKLFSSGTQDQADLALRLALAELLDPEQNLPLLCDDPFVNYDEERGQKAYELLAQLAQEGRQILLVTCHRAPRNFDSEQEGVQWSYWKGGLPPRRISE